MKWNGLKLLYIMNILINHAALAVNQKKGTHRLEAHGSVFFSAMCAGAGFQLEHSEISEPIAPGVFYGWHARWRRYHAG